MTDTKKVVQFAIDPTDRWTVYILYDNGELWIRYMTEWRRVPLPHEGVK